MAVGLPPGFELETAPRVEPVTFSSDRQLPMPVGGSNVPIPAWVAARPGAAPAAAAAPRVALPPGFELENPDKVGMGGGILRAVAEGVPLVGALPRRFNATTAALLEPVLPGDETISHKKTLNERFAENLKREEARSTGFAKEHPVVSTLANVAGGIGGIGGALKAAPAVVGPLLGTTAETLPGQILASAGSGAGLSAADAALRGEDPKTAAVVGAGLGAAGPVAAKVIGAGINAFRPSARAAAAEARANPTPENTVNVAGVEVPLRRSEVTGDRQLAGEEQAFLATNHPVAVAHEAQRAQKLEEVGDAFSRNLNPATAEVAGSPQAAGNVISDSIQAQAARDKAAYQRLYTDFGELPGELPRGVFSKVGDSIRNRLSSGTQPIVIDEVTTPYAARALKDVDKNIGTGAFANLARRSDAPPAAPVAAAQPAPAAAIEVAPAVGGPPPLTLGQFIRKEGGLELSPEMKAADLHQALVPGKVGPVAHAEGKSIDSFWRERLQEEGYLPRDADGYMSRDIRDELIHALQQEAAGHPTYRAADQHRVGVKPPMDDYSKAIEGHAKDIVAAAKDVGLTRGDIDTADLYSAAEMLYRGHAADPVSALEIAMGERGAAPAHPLGKAPEPPLTAPTPEAPGISLKAIDDARKRLVTFAGQAKASRNEADYRATQAVIKQLDNHLEDALDAGLFSGSDLALPTLRAARQHFSYYQKTFGSQGSGDTVGQKMQRILGKFENQQATPSEIANYLYGSTGANGTGATVGVAQRVRSIFGADSPEWAAVRQGMWRRLSEAGEGQTAFGPQKQSERILKFLNDSGGAATDGEGKALSQVLFSNQERETMREIAGVLKQMVPPPRTTNPSGTAPMLQRILTRSVSHLGTMLGLVSHGPVGAIVGYGIDKGIQRGLQRYTDRQAAQRARELFYGAPGRQSFRQLAPASYGTQLGSLRFGGQQAQGNQQ